MKLTNYLTPAMYRFLLIISTFTILGCDVAGKSLVETRMNRLSARLESIYGMTKTVCFGHFLVDVPATATVVYGPASINGPIEYYPEEASHLGDYVANRLIEIEKDRIFLSDEDIVEFPLFGRVIAGEKPANKIAIGSKNQVGYDLYSFFSVGDDLFIQTLYGVLEYDETIHDLNSVASNLRVRVDDEIPTEAGTCIDGAFIPMSLEHEKVTIGIRLKEFPDVHFSIEVHKNQSQISEFSDLETRLKGAERAGGDWFSRVKFFRRGERQIDNWMGSEALALKPAQPDQKAAHEFRFIGLGAPDDPLLPQIDIQLDTGANDRQMGAVKPSLTDDEVVALWDKLTGTIRVRPVSAKKPAKIPLASTVATGEICPESGWWQCDEAGVIASERRRRIAAGDVMPYAIIPGEQGLWQKLKGEQPRYRTPAVWKLVGYEEISPPPADDHA